MALRTTLDQLVEMLRDEIKGSSNSSRGTDHRAYLERIIKRHYETLCDDYEWSFLKVNRGEARKELEAGARYYDFPVAMDVRDTIKCFLFYGNVWTELEYGIDHSHYTQMDPDLGQRADPALRWQIKDGRQFEVWPLPASDGDLGDPDDFAGPFVEFTGMRKPEALTAGDSRADMDDQLIVLACKAEIKEEQKTGSGLPAQRAFITRLQNMKNRYGGGRRRVRIGMGAHDGSRFPAQLIRAFPASN